MSTTLRPADAYRYAAFRSTLADSDCNAIFANGDVLPVLIEDGGTELYIEHEYRFYPPVQFPGFVKFQTKPEEIQKREAEKAAAEAAEAARAQKLGGSNWRETQADVALRNARALSERYSGAHAKDSAGEAQYKGQATEFEAARAKHTRSRI